MKRTLVLALGLAVAMAAEPVDAQLFNVPNYATPSAYGMPSTFVAAGYGRGLNDASGKQDGYYAAIGRSGIGDRVTVFAGGSMIDSDPDAEWSFGGTVGLDVMPDGGSTQVSVQAGVGYLSIDPITFTQFPIGVALKTQIEGPTATVSPWIMPRLHVSRASASGVSNTETDFGVSGGFGVTLPSGFGIHTALDLLAAGENANAWLLGVGLHYVFP